MNDDSFDLLHAALEVQCGYVTRVQARSFGFTRDELRWQVHKGALLTEGPRLLTPPGVPISKARPLMRAVLDAGSGAVLTGGAAAAWWGLPGYSLLDLDVMRPRGVTRVKPVFARRLREVLDLTTDQVTVLDGIPIVRPERMAFDLLAEGPKPRAWRAVETAWSKGLLSGDSLEFVFEQLAEQGRLGTVATREFLEEHPPHWIPPASNVEARVADLLHRNVLGVWRRQVDLGGERWVGRVDFLHERLPIILEVQSERYHSALIDRAADAARKARLEALGFVVVEVWDTDIWYRPDLVIAKVRAAVRSFTATAV